MSCECESCGEHSMECICHYDEWTRKDKKKICGSCGKIACKILKLDYISVFLCADCAERESDGKGYIYCPYPVSVKNIGHE